ncbi:glycosyltransferase family 2 protein [bacterium]|nr:glycosyltransferase family 2 protein [bacterium]
MTSSVLPSRAPKSSTSPSAANKPAISLSDVTVVLPAFNEAASIAEILDRLNRVLPGAKLLVVDDGSGDATADLARKAGAEVIVHEENFGNGAAVKTGIRAASTPILVLMDSDGQHPPDAIPKLLDALQDADMVVASRSAAAQSAFRRFGNAVLSGFASLLAGRRIPDLTSGFRAARRDALLEYVHLFPNGFSYPTTSTIAFLKGGFRVKFLPVQGMERRTKGVSKIRPFRDGLKFLTIMVRLAVLFEPVRVFVPPGAFLLVTGAGLLGFQVISWGRIEELPILLILSGMIILFVGFLADLVASLTTRRRL